MKIGVVKEIHKNETRVAATPQTITKLKTFGFDVSVEAGLGLKANFADEDYKQNGAEILQSAKDVWQISDIVLKIHPPGTTLDGKKELDLCQSGQIIIAMFSPATNQELLAQLAAKNITALSMDTIPRITRAQRMDVLSSMANIAGYRAVIEASNAYGSFFTGQTTAAGSVPPAKVLIIGAGVAGLAALGAAKGLGAIVRAFDTRATVKEQVESLGGEFLTVDITESGEGKGGYAKVMSKEFIDAEMKLFRQQAKEVDIVITTALVPGKKAPMLWTEDMVESMKAGSVVIDLAAKNGGNCELTELNQSIVKHGVTIVGFDALPRQMPTVASQLYGTNITHFLDELGKNDHFRIDHNNAITRGALLTQDGNILWPPPVADTPSPLKKPSLKKSPPQSTHHKSQDQKPSRAHQMMVMALAILAGLGWLYLRFSHGASGLNETTQVFLQHLTVFVLACFIGWQVVWSVTSSLHTPLMSVTNAISGIIVVGGILQGRQQGDSLALYIGTLAILFATINIFGGFLVTHRMLQMFKK